jgi:hypothetical protein
VWDWEKKKIHVYPVLAHVWEIYLSQNTGRDENKQIVT